VAYVLLAAIVFFIMLLNARAERHDDRMDELRRRDPAKWRAEFDRRWKGHRR
jgi:hypothetical protein